MAVYPGTPVPSVGSKESYIIPLVKSESDGNYIRVRRRATRKRETFELQYNVMTFAQYETLKAFFSANQGSSFTWVHPITGKQHTVVFNMDKLERVLRKTHCETTVMLEEL